MATRRGPQYGAQQGPSRPLSEPFDQNDEFRQRVAQNELMATGTHTHKQLDVMNQEDYASMLEKKKNVAQAQRQYDDQQYQQNHQATKNSIQQRMKQEQREKLAREQKEKEKEQARLAQERLDRVNMEKLKKKKDKSVFIYLAVDFTDDMDLDEMYSGLNKLMHEQAQMKAKQFTTLSVVSFGQQVYPLRVAQNIRNCITFDRCHDTMHPNGRYRNIVQLLEHAQRSIVSELGTYDHVIMVILMAGEPKPSELVKNGWFSKFTVDLRELASWSNKLSIGYMGGNEDGQLVRGLFKDNGLDIQQMPLGLELEERFTIVSDAILHIRKELDIN